MTNLIGGSQARTIAEARWGKGGTTGYRVNRTGCFYYSCSGHGGFVIDERALSKEELELMRPHMEEVKCVAYRDSKGVVRRLRHDLAMKTRNFEVYSSWAYESFSVFLAEEDCAWCIPVVFAGIATRDRAGDEHTADALETYKRWYDPSNHQLAAVQARIRDRSGRAAA